MKRKFPSYPKFMGIAVSVLVPILSYYLLEAMTHSPFEIPFHFQVLGWLVCGLTAGLLFFVTGRMNLSLILMLLMTCLLGTANYFVLAFRGSPILPWDIASAGTALSVADHFTFTVSLRLGLIWAAFVLLLAACLPVRLRLKKRPRLRLAGLGGSLALFAALVLCLQSDAAGAFLGVYEMPFTQDYVYRQNGFFVSFLVNTKYLKVDEPVDYSPEEADRLLTESEGASSSDDAPNIIVVMDEAFSDLSVIGDFQASEDYMPISTPSASQKTRCRGTFTFLFWAEIPPTRNLSSSQETPWPFCPREASPISSISPRSFPPFRSF